MKKQIALFLAAGVAALAIGGCSSAPAASSGAASNTASAGEQITITVGASPSPHAEILKVAAEVLKEQNIILEVKEFTDYVMPNTSLEEGQLDANYFQHKPYMDTFNSEHSTHLLSIGAIHYEPFGIYAGRTKDLKDLPDGATVAVPNDTSNEARALLLLQDQGLLKLKDGVGLEATVKDIVENPKNINFKEIKAAQLPRSLPDVDVAVINGNYAIEGGLKVSDALAVEKDDSVAADTYANIVAVRDSDKDRPELKALVEALKSEQVKKYIQDTYEGAVIPSK